MRRRRTSSGYDLVARATDRSLLWVAVAGGLALSRGRLRRRAALRGLVAGGLAAAIAAGPVDLAAGRRRRRGRGQGPVARWRGAEPFRAGSAAAAFAFALGAAQEAPVLAAPLVGLASLVGYARLRTGRNDAAAGATGAALGVGTALATRHLWPVAPHEPAQVRTALVRTDVDPSPGGGGVVVVVNPSAGSSGRAAEELRAELPEAEVVELAEGDDLEAALRGAAERGCVLGVAGGDGSINAAATLAAEHDKPLLVVPGGTLNHFAYALGLESIADAAAAMRDGRAAAVDRGLIDGQTFVNTASIGSYVELVDAREKLEHRIGKWPAVFVSLWGVLRRSEPLDLEVDGERRQVWMIFVGNCRYHPSGFAPSWREHLDDGELDVRIADGTRPWSRVRLVLAVLTGRLARCGAYEQRRVQSLHVRSLNGPLRLARDGETFDGPVEVTIGKADTPLRVFVPE